MIAVTTVQQAILVHVHVLQVRMNAVMQQAA